MIQLFGIRRALKENVFLLCKAHSETSVKMYVVYSHSALLSPMATIFFIQKEKQSGICFQNNLKSSLEAFDRIPMGF
jgi:hypothetical protein